MGKGICIKCKECGYKWSHKTEVGMIGPAQNNEDDTTKAMTPTGEKVNVIKCPKCGAIEMEVTAMFLWD